MSSKWDAISPEAQVLSEPLNGPTMVLRANGCHLIANTADNEDRRNENLILRLHQVAIILAAAGCPGISTSPTEAYARINGGNPPVYVRGDTDQEIFTTLAKGMISASSEVRAQLDRLSIRAVTEW